MQYPQWDLIPGPSALPTELKETSTNAVSRGSHMYEPTVLRFL